MDQDTSRQLDSRIDFITAVAGYRDACHELKKLFPGNKYPDYSFTSKIVELTRTKETSNIIIATHIMLNYIKENK
jgi:hypothetical protein